jgi:hypothetical protein
LNPSVMSVGKIAWRHHAVAYFQTNCIPHRRNRRYRPTEYFRRYISKVSPTGLFRWYIPTDFETKLFLSVYITDGKIPSVILLVFSGFLVVWDVLHFDCDSATQSFLQLGQVHIRTSSSITTICPI